MIKVLVSKQSNYPVSSVLIKNKLKKFLKDSKIVSDSEVSVALVSEQRMLELAKMYLKEVSTIPHNVLSFPSSEDGGSRTKSEDKFTFPPDGKIYLGEIVVCYPKAVEEAKREDKLIKDKVIELVEHGALHLIGIHH